MKIIDAHLHIWTRVPQWRGFQTPQPSYGKVLIDGREHDMLPPSFVDSTSPPELAVAFMDRYGVESAFLVQEALDGFLNDVVGEAVRAWPERFLGVALMDPRDPYYPGELEKLFNGGMMRGLKIPFGTFRQLVPEFDLLSTPASDWLKICDRLSRFVIIHPPDPAEFAPMMAEIAVKYGGARFIIAHMGLPNKPGWEDILDLCRLPNVFMDLSAVPLLMREEYPCPKSRELLRIAISKIGANKLLWGTDFPRTLNDMTYRQLIDWAAGCEGVSEEDISLIMGLNARSFFA